MLNKEEINYFISKREQDQEYSGTFSLKLTLSSLCSHCKRLLMDILSVQIAKEQTEMVVLNTVAEWFKSHSATVEISTSDHQCPAITGIGCEAKNYTFFCVPFTGD